MRKPLGCGVALRRCSRPLAPPGRPPLRCPAGTAREVFSVRELGNMVGAYEVVRRTRQVKVLALACLLLAGCAGSQAGGIATTPTPSGSSGNGHTRVYRGHLHHGGHFRISDLPSPPRPLPFPSSGSGVYGDVVGVPPCGTGCQIPAAGLQSQGVSIFAAGSEREVAHRSTNYFGQFRAALAPGRYVVKIVPRNPPGAIVRSCRSGHITVRSGGYTVTYIDCFLR